MDEFAEFSEVINDHIKGVFNASNKPCVEFGIITADNGLKIDRFPTAIPKGDYMLSSHIAGDSIEISGGTHSGHLSGNGEHKHEIILPALKAGDRVVVLWCGNEPVVVAVIIRS